MVGKKKGKAGGGKKKGKAAGGKMNPGLAALLKKVGRKTKKA
jgi:hypothetical protein|tara:strand:+ start:124 stop:249 length:126 start_codon:yes stop_codon:yes gene_type:complete